MLRHRGLNRWTLLPIIAALLLVISAACGGGATATPIVREVVVERTVEVPVEVPVDVERTVVVERTVEVPVDVERTVIVERTVLIRPTTTPVPVATPVPTIDPNLAKYGGNIQMSAYADTRDWDPLGSSSLSSVKSYSQLYNQIVQPDTTDTVKIICDLCSSWDISNGGQTFSFKIRDGVKWQDGEDLTADDVVYGLARYMNPEVSIGRSGLFRNYALPVEEGGIKLVGDDTVEFNLTFASGAFIKFLALNYVKVLPKHLLEQGIDLNQAENVIEHKSGSGPFILDEYKRGNVYAVSRNPNYFKEGRPYFNGIDHFIIVDSGTVIAQFKGGQLDMANSSQSNLTPTENMQLDQDTIGARNGHVISYELPPSFNVMFMMNRKAEPFTDLRVRKAIYLALDRQQINSLLQDDTAAIPCPMMGMGYTYDDCLTWPGLRPKDTPGGQADIAEAKRLMAEAGFPDGFSTKFDARQVAGYDEVCSVVKQQLKETLGITGDLQTWESAAGYAMLSTARPADAIGDWELACQGEGTTVLDADGVLGGVYIPGATRNYTDWSPTFIEEKFEQQKVELDPDARRDILKEIEDYLVYTDPDDLTKGYVDNHTSTVYWGKFFWIVHEDIKGFLVPQSNQTVFKHEDIWLDR